jgi:hypothetical protein
MKFVKDHIRTLFVSDWSDHTNKNKYVNNNNNNNNNNNLFEFSSYNSWGYPLISSELSR